jgi:hypothetical protein
MTLQLLVSLLEMRKSKEGKIGQKVMVGYDKKNYFSY